MKRGRILALFLSLILLVSTAIPVIQMSVMAGQEEVNNAIADIKTAYAEMTYNNTGFKATRLYQADGTWDDSIKNVDCTEATDIENYGLYKYTVPNGHIAGVINAGKVMQIIEWDAYGKGEAANFLNKIPLDKIEDLYVNVKGAYEGDTAGLTDAQIKIRYKVVLTEVINGVGKNQVIDGPAITVKPNEVTRISYKQILAEGDSLKSFLEGEVAKKGSTAGIASLTDVRLVFNTPGFLTEESASLTVGSGIVVTNEAIHAKLPAELENCTDIYEAIEIADSAYNSGEFENTLPLKKAIEDACTVAANEKQELYNDPDKLMDYVKTNLWPELIYNSETVVKQFTHYNSSGNLPNYTANYDIDAPEGDYAAQYIAGVTESANSGAIPTYKTDDSNKAQYGDSYAKLTTAKTDSNGNDIAYLDTTRSVLTNVLSRIDITKAKSIRFSLKSSMNMTVKTRIWYYHQNIDGTGKAVGAVQSGNINIVTGMNTIDVYEQLKNERTKLAGLDKEMVELAYVTIGISSMSKTPDATDYLEVGNVMLKSYINVPANVIEMDDIIPFYEAMAKVNLNEFEDGEIKDEFIVTREAAKKLADAKMEAIYQDPDKLAVYIKELWSGLVSNPDQNNIWTFYNSSGNEPNMSWEHDNSKPGANPDESGKYTGESTTPEQKELYGSHYIKMTTAKEIANPATPADKDIPYLDTKCVVINSDSSKMRITNFSNVAELYFYANSSMPLKMKIRVWYYSTTDGNGDGMLNDLAAAAGTFSIDAGMNKVDVLKMFDSMGISGKVDNFLRIAVAITDFDHTPTNSDYLELGAVTHNRYEKLPERLESISALGAIAKEASELNMDNYIDNNGKEMFKTAVNRALEYLSVMDVNLTEHSPIEVYETDSTGKRKKLGEDKFGYNDQVKLYDGNTLDNPVELDAKNKQIDIIYNLNDKMKIYDLRVFLQENNIKNMKIYATPVREIIWDEDGFVYEYDGSDPSVLDIGRAFSEPIENQYVRFSFNEIEGATLKLTEIKCMGKGIQQLAHTNVVLNKQDAVSVSEVDYKLEKSKILSPTHNKFGDSIYQFLDYNVINDGDLKTPYDLVGGSRFEADKLTYNIVLDLNGLSAVDEIAFYSGSNEEYFPQKMKFYLGTDIFDIVDPKKDDAQLVAEFNEPAEDGMYKANFLARNAQFVRIEILKGGTIVDTGDYGDKILSVVSDIQVKGLSLNASKSDTVRSFTDAESGIIVDILKNSDGDIYEGVQGMKIEKRKPTDAEVEQATGFSFTFNDYFYTITLLNYRGEPVTDIEGREIRVSIPYGEDPDFENTFVSSVDGGDVVLLEHSVTEMNDQFYMTIMFDDPTKLNVAVGRMELAEVEDETYEEDYFEDYFEEEEQPFEEEEAEEEDDDEDDDSTTKRKKKYYKVVRKGSSGLDLWIIIVIIAGSVILLAGIILLIIFRKKIFRKREKKA